MKPMTIRSLPFLAALATALVLALGASFAFGAPLTIGASMPSTSISMEGVDGKALTLAKAKGTKGTLVVFTCNHCPYVKAWEQRIAALGNEYAAQGFGVVAVNSNDPSVRADDGMDGMKERARALALSFPYVVDKGSILARAFGAERTPEVFLFDAAGKLVYHGAVDDNADDAAAVKSHYLKDALDALLAGTPVPAATTKAMGCSIKLYPEKTTR